MLAEIHIENFTIIDRSHLELESKMTAITGETGAGKSILVDALSYALGNRADAAVVRSGTDKADIHATFEFQQDSAVAAWLQNNEFPHEDGQVILRRVISADGRSKAYINGKPATLALQKQLGQQLVDIHGQHEYHNLLKTSYQAKLLDRFAAHGELLEQVSKAYQAWQSAAKQLQTLREQDQESKARKELLSYQVEELDNANFSDEELSELDQQHKRLANAQEIKSIGYQVQQVLSEKDGAATEQLNSALHHLEQLAQLDDNFQSPLDILNQALSLVEDAQRETEGLSESIEIDDEQLAYLDERIALAHDLARKHKVAPEKLPELQQQLQLELDQLHSSSEQVEALESQIAQLQQQYTQLAVQLSQSRQRAATKLAKEIVPMIQKLGMPHGKLEFKVDYQKEHASALGQDKIEIFVSTNPDQALQPLSQVASGGELSRISLAIEVITLEKQSATTLIFDEVDVGIGGGTAEVVGQMLRSVGDKVQVLCITHQAQVAGQAHNHIKVAKSHSKQSTSSQLEYLAKEQRVEEMARMLGGVNISETTLAAAKELLATS